MTINARQIAIATASLTGLLLLGDSAQPVFGFEIRCAPNSVECLKFKRQAEAQSTSSGQGTTAPTPAQDTIATTRRTTTQWLYVPDPCRGQTGILRPLGC